MKKILVAFILLFIAVPAWSGDFYIAQSAAGSANGADCANAHALSGLTWGAGNDVAPGDTLHLCGTFTGALSVGAAGSAGNKITIFFETDSKFSAAVWANTGAIDLNGYDYLTIDGGTNGIIENTGNGTELANQTSATRGIDADGASYLIVKNLTIQNMYVRTSNTDQAPASFGSGPTSIHGAGTVTDVTIDNCTFTHAVGAITYVTGSAAMTNLTFSNNTFSNIDHNISVGATTATITNTIIYGNLFSDYYNWDDTAGNKYHHNSLHIYSTGSATFNGFYVYKNKSFGNPGSLATSHFYFENGTGGTFNNLHVYNNLFPEPTGSVAPWAAIVLGSSSGTGITNSIVANNTIFGKTAANYGILLSGGAGNAAVVKNNIIIGTRSAIYAYTAIANVNLDNNLYSLNTNIGMVNGGSSYTTLAGWRTYLGDSRESGTIATATHGVNDNGTLTAGSVAIDNGVSLPTYYETDYASTPRPQGSAWDIGAYEYDVGTPDATPSAFSFSDVTGAALSTETTTSPGITVAGIDAGQTPAITISGAGCTYNIDGGAFTADAGTVGLDNVVLMKVTSSASYSTAKTCTLTIGGVSDIWSVTTQAAVEDVDPPTPPRFRGSGRGRWR